MPPLISFPRLSRRQLLAVSAVGALSRPGQGFQRASASDWWDVYATTIRDDSVNLRTAAGNESDIVATLPPGATVLLVDGPVDGWYAVATVDDGGAYYGWIAGWLLVFEQRARAVADVPLLGGPDDWSDELGWVRRGFNLTMIGPVAGDWVLVRSGDRSGYTPVRSLEPSAGEETDRFAEWWVDVDRTSAVVRLYVGDTVVDRFDAAVSADPGEGFYSTAIGTYGIYQKIAGLTYTPYADAYFKHWAGFDPERYNGFHSWTMDADGNVLNGGWGTTAGCVATDPANAEIIFDFVEIGTRIEIHW